MSDPSEDEETPGSYVFPVPPDDGLLSRLSFKARAAITTGEFAGALTCAAAAWSVGGDMSLTITALLAGWVLGLIGIATVPGKNEGWRVLAAMGLFLLFAGEGGFLYWHFHGQSSEAPDKLLPKNENDKSLDLTVQFNCEWTQPPTVAPQHKLYELELNNALGMIDGGVFVSFSQQPGTPINMVTPDAPSQFYRCRFSNLGTVSVLNLTIEITVQFHEVIKLENGTRSGDVLETKKVQTPPISLGAGQIFDFYVRNYSAFFVGVVWSPTATGQAAGNEKMQTFKLVPIQFAAFGLRPFIRVDNSQKATSVPLPAPRRPVR